MQTSTSRVLHQVSLGPRVARGKLSDYNVVCTMPDLRTARTVIEELGRRGGVEADNISLTGPAPHETAFQQQTAQADRAMLDYWLRRSTPWAILGAIAGSMLGMIVVASLPVEASAANFFTAACTAAAGVGIGAWLVAGSYLLQPAQPWELTFHDTSQGAAFVAVHSDKKEDVDLAEQIFRELGLNSMRRQDRAAPG